MWKNEPFAYFVSFALLTYLSWFFRGNVLTLLINMRSEVQQILIEKRQSLGTYFDDPNWGTNLHTSVIYFRFLINCTFQSKDGKVSIKITKFQPIGKNYKHGRKEFIEIYDMFPLYCQLINDEEIIFDKKKKMILI